MDFKDYLKVASKDLDKEIKRILGIWGKEAIRFSSKFKPLIEAFIKACQGGKRIRGILVKLGYEMAGGGGKDILRVSAAIEILHTGILIHDDVIDQSPLRRGQPTLYRVLGGDHYGISQAIALADCGFFLIVKIMADANFPAQHKSAAISYFSQTIIDTGLGEVLDMELPHLGGERKEEDVVAIHTLKTARYTISGPLILGAILAGANEKLVKVLGEFGESLGIAFQIQDDILGVFGDESELGKSATSDIEEGKNTLLITEALKRSNPAQRKILDQYYGKGAVGRGGLGQVRKVFLETGSLDYSRQMGVKYVAQAKKLIPKITKDKNWAETLTGMADFLVERES